MKKPYFIIVAGGSASGKTTVVNEILQLSKIDDVSRIAHDDYYNDLSTTPIEKRLDINYDHPDSLDNDLLYEHLMALLSNKPIKKPTYDFVSYNRSSIYEDVKPKPVIILEGILALTDARIRDLADLKIFVDTDDDLRLIRRILRDTRERGRSIDSIISQYLHTVKPMYYKYVKPTVRHADIIIPNDKKHDAAVDLIVTKLKMVGL